MYSFGSTIRVCGTFSCFRKVGNSKQRHKPHAKPGQSVASAFLAVDHADSMTDGQVGIAQSLDGTRGGPARSDHVLDEADELARLGDALQAVVGAVALRLLADDQKRQSGRERCRGRERDRAQLGAGESNRVGLRGANRIRERLSERRQQLGPRLEAVLVEVVGRAPARAQDEIALEIGVLAQRRRQLGALH